MRRMAAMPIGLITIAIGFGNRRSIIGNSIITIPGRYFRIGRSGRNGSPYTRPLFRLKIRQPQQFRIARDIGADESLGFVHCFRHGLKPEAVQALQRGCFAHAIH
jgi:hypothetical protein